MVSRSEPRGSRYWLDGHPELVHEWDAEANGELCLNAITAGSGLLVWWRCSAGPDHLWRAKPNNRTRGAGCPFCANRRVSVTNALASIAPELAREWHPEKNGRVGPSDVVATSTRVVWWRCPRDSSHEWRARTRDRLRAASACPYCANKRACPSNSLAASHPAVAAEWSSSRNGTLTPSDVTAGSARRVWWRCAGCAHEWRATVANRVVRASACPECARRGQSHAHEPRPHEDHRAPRRPRRQELSR